MTRSDFIANYEGQLKQRYSWAADAQKLDRFMRSCVTTLDGASTWIHDGEAVVDAWRAIGGKGKPTLKALRALIKESD